VALFATEPVKVRYAGSSGLSANASPLLSLTYLGHLAGSKSEADQCDCPTSRARTILRYRHAIPSHGRCDRFDSKRV